MVRVNLIQPKFLADQHLIAEYAEILMLMAYIKSYPDTTNLPKEFCLGTGHQRFFKDKVGYLKERHEHLKKEMKKRGFHPKKSVKTIGIKKSLINNWRPTEKDKQIIKKRIMQRIKEKPTYYRYYGEQKPLTFFSKLLKQAK